MATGTQSMPRPSFSDRMHVPRSRGAVSGFLLVLLGLWGAFISFVGPIFGYAFTPDTSWDFTMGRLWLEILPGAAAVIGGLILLGSANRAVTSFGGWLAALGGAWFVVGPSLSRLWNNGVAAAGAPASANVTQSVMEEIGFFFGLGAVILFLASMALGRMSVLGVRDIRTGQPAPVEPAAAPVDTGSGATTDERG